MISFSSIDVTYLNSLLRMALLLMHHVTLMTMVKYVIFLDEGRIFLRQMAI